jgi:hypothetical protein
MSIPTAGAPYQILVRNAARRRVGEVTRLTALTLTPVFNGVGGFSITLPADDPKSSLLSPGGWLQFLSEDSEITSGQIRGIKLIKDDSNPFSGTFTIYGPTSEQVIADRLAFPVPTLPAAIQSGAEYDIRSGAAETVIKGYVSANTKPSAGAGFPRSTAGLIIEPDLGRGDPVSASARMNNLLDLITTLAQSVGLGFRVSFNTLDQLVFSVYEPTDRSGSAKFGTELGNLVSFEQTTEAAKTNVAIVGGSGSGTARVFREVADTPSQTAWANRTESFVDQQDTATTTELDQAGVSELVTNGPISGVTIKTIDTPKLRFSRDYFLGDVVSIPEANVTDVLRTLTITWSADAGQSVETTVGTASMTGTRKMIQMLALLNAKVSLLQTNT